jgi:hypothetical protein
MTLPVVLSRSFKLLAALFALALGMVLIVAAFVLHALTPKPGEWSTPVRLGPVERALSVPVLLRWATHPLAAPWIDGRIVTTRAGRWVLRATPDGRMHATCAPCTLRLPALGTQPVTLASAQVRAQRTGPEAWRGTLALGDAPAAVELRWLARLERNAVTLDAELPATPLAPVAALFGTAVAEAHTARIDGTLALKLAVRVDAHGLHLLSLLPQFADVSVSGLGTEALATADPRGRCARAPARIDGWLPRAVVAAEDQRFFEHGGFDVEEWKNAWVQDPAQPARTARLQQHRGASTITQQLAKLVYTGDERSAVRKLREWLYAVEMERTLGKGRILQLYLALAPWGEGVCGAEAASRRYLGKSARKLAPHEAAWLASLLTRPDAQVARWRARGEIDVVRTAWVIDGLRSLPKSQRQTQVEQLLVWQPGAALSSAEPAPLRHVALPAP